VLWDARGCPSAYYHECIRTPFSCCYCAGKKQKLSGAQLKTKGWILKKKAQMRQKGYTSIPVDTKYTGRKRKKII
jgi:hypothetical protein